jgi:hypothetical protein
MPGKVAPSLWSLLVLLGWLLLLYAAELAVMGETNTCGCNIGRRSESTLNQLSNSASHDSQCNTGEASSCGSLNAVREQATESIKRSTICVNRDWNNEGK